MQGRAIIFSTCNVDNISVKLIFLWDINLSPCSPTINCSCLLTSPWSAQQASCFVRKIIKIIRVVPGKLNCMVPVTSGVELQLISAC